MKTFYTFIALLLSASMVYAQQLETCASHHYLEHLEEQHPGFAAAADAIFSQANQGQARDFTLVSIPVVVHIVYQDENQNIADATIDSVITSLTQDYRRLNGDANQVRDIFTDRVGDSFIEFELAHVERVQTTATFELDLFGGGLPDNVKRSASGGSDAWDPNSYLNIWVCNIEGGALLGYAYPPADLDHWPANTNAPESDLDGVVIHYEAFKTSGTITVEDPLGGSMTTPIRGRTVTHEVGHYLGLRHIWGDGTLSVLGIPDCNVDDGVEDTPNQGVSSQFQCDESLNTCTDTTDDLPDMFENYMDYSMEDCQNSFTNGQIDIMRSVLDNQRSGLIMPVSTQNIQAADVAMRIHPNPSNNFLNVRLLNATQQEQAYFNITDQFGRLLQAWHNNDQTQKIDVSTLAPGVYFLNRYTKSDQESIRFVVQ